MKQQARHARRLSPACCISKYHTPASSMPQAAGEAAGMQASQVVQQADGAWLGSIGEAAVGRSNRQPPPTSSCRQSSCMPGRSCRSPRCPLAPATGWSPGIRSPRAMPGHMALLVRCLTLNQTPSLAGSCTQCSSTSSLWLNFKIKLCDPAIPSTEDADILQRFAVL